MSYAGWFERVEHLACCKRCGYAVIGGGCGCRPGVSPDYGSLLRVLAIGAGVAVAVAALGALGYAIAMR